MPFHEFSPYRTELTDLLATLAEPQVSPRMFAIAHEHLDGAASREFRRRVPLSVRRETGTFFTGSSTRARALSRYGRSIRAGVTIFDPACGLGDLLLAAAELLPVSWSPADRVRQAASRVCGRDIDATLATVAATRLALWAGVNGVIISPDEFQMSTGDAFADDVAWSSYGLIALNPPYGIAATPAGVGWANGSTTAAAPFTLGVLERARPGAKVVAILPDVLRSGSRYSRWRQAVENLADIVAIDVVGLFDRWTDIDVFIAHLQKRPFRQEPSTAPGEWYDRPTGKTLAALASVAVGDVVPHRHVQRGDEVGYLTAASVPVGATVTAAAALIQHSGRLHNPPFVVVRRTSAPSRGSAPRLSSSVYAGHDAVAVENHLLVVKPHDGTLHTAERLSRALRSPAVTAWLNDRLRLRHLTVQALKDLPAQCLGPLDTLTM